MVLSIFDVLYYFAIRTNIMCYHTSSVINDYELRFVLRLLALTLLLSTSQHSAFVFIPPSLYKNPHILPAFGFKKPG